LIYIEFISARISGLQVLSCFGAEDLLRASDTRTGLENAGCSAPVGRPADNVARSGLPAKNRALAAEQEARSVFHGRSERAAKLRQDPVGHPRQAECVTSPINRHTSAKPTWEVLAPKIEAVALGVKRRLQFELIEDLKWRRP
jgi:hypothetical protein